MFNVVCLKWGNKYSTDYVNKLASAVQRNLEGPVTVHCVTDDSEGIDEGIVCHPLAEVDMLGGWWWKVTLFNPEFYPNLPDRFLFLDLDVVITGDLLPFFEVSPECGFVGTEDFMLAGFNSSVFFLDRTIGNNVWTHFLKCTPVGRPLQYYQHGGDVYAGDQNLIYAAFNKRLPFYPKTYSRSYKADGKAKVIDKEPRIVVFHGKPDPHEVVAIDWVASNWR